MTGGTVSVLFFLIYCTSIRVISRRTRACMQRQPRAVTIKSAPRGRAASHRGRSLRSLSLSRPSLEFTLRFTRRFRTTAFPRIECRRRRGSPRHRARCSVRDSPPCPRNRRLIRELSVQDPRGRGNDDDCVRSLFFSFSQPSSFSLSRIDWIGFSRVLSEVLDEPRSEIPFLLFPRAL